MHLHYSLYFVVYIVFLTPDMLVLKEFLYMYELLVFAFFKGLVSSYISIINGYYHYIKS